MCSLGSGEGSGSPDGWMRLETASPNSIVYAADFLSFFGLPFTVFCPSLLILMLHSFCPPWILERVALKMREAFKSWHGHKFIEPQLKGS